MHLPYPARKDSNPAPFQPRSSSSRKNGLRFGKGLTLPRRYRQHGIAITVFVLIALVWLFTHGDGSNSRYGGPVGLADHIPSGSPPAVIVTVLDEARFGAKYTALLKENRKLYAEKHGYETFFPKVGDYDLLSAPNSWTKVVAMRHAMTKFPDATYLWYVDVDAFIMSPHLSIEKDIMATAKLEEKMIVDHPVVPPDSIIHTFSHLRGEDVNFLLTQDKQGLVTSTFILRNSEWSRFFLETWFDPIYRSYNFQKAETHALEHIVQWHPTILSKLALVPQRTINSYSSAARGEEYQTGDLAVRFPSCTKSSKNPTCEAEAEPYAMVWRSAFRNR